MGALVYAVVIVFTGLVWAARLALQLLVLCVVRPKVGLPLLAVVVMGSFILFRMYAGPVPNSGLNLFLHLESSTSATATATADYAMQGTSSLPFIDETEGFYQGGTAVDRFSNPLSLQTTLVEMRSVATLNPGSNSTDGSLYSIFLKNVFKELNNAGVTEDKLNWSTYQALDFVALYKLLAENGSNGILSQDKITLSKKMVNDVIRHHITGNTIQANLNPLIGMDDVTLPNGVTASTLIASIPRISK